MSAEARESRAISLPLPSTKETTLTAEEMMKAWVKRHEADVEVTDVGRVRLVEMFQFAEREKKLEQLEAMLDRCCFPTFFGAPAVTVLHQDFAPHSLYFEIYPRDLPKERRERFLMNGGFIYHQSVGEWSIHT